MDVSRPAGIALPSGTEAVLHVLAGTDSPLGVREIARIAGVSANRASQVLSELGRHGLVLVEAHGSVHLCRLNRAHLAAEPVLGLVGLRGRLLEFLRAEITGWPVRPVHASLFGSAARGDGDTESDLDLLVVQPDQADRESWEAQLFEAGERILAATGNRAAWFSIACDDLERAVKATEPILAEWRRDGIHLAGPRLSQLLRQVA